MDNARAICSPDTHWAVKNPGKADQYRREAEAARVALGFSANSDDVSPREITDSIQAIKDGARQTVSALECALTRLEEYAVTVDAEWGSCRSLAEMEADNDLPECIINVRAALAAHHK